MKNLPPYVIVSFHWCLASHSFTQQMLMEHLLCAWTALGIQFFYSMSLCQVELWLQGWTSEGLKFKPILSLALVEGEWVSELHHKVSVKKPNWNFSDMVKFCNYHSKPDVRARDGSGRHIQYLEAKVKLWSSIWKKLYLFRKQNGFGYTEP